MTEAADAGIARLRVILMTGPVPAFVVEKVRALVPTADVRYYPDRAALETAIGAADVVATDALSPDALARAQRLKWIQSWSAGPDALLFPEMIASPVLLTSCKGNGAVPLAEHALMLLLMLDRQAARSLKAQSERRWDRFYHGELNGRTCGIIGTGHAGIDLAGKLRAFHMRVLGLRRREEAQPAFDRIYRQDELHAFLGRCDAVVVTAPLTDSTRGMLDADAFAAMKDGTLYVCISRGGIADDAALLDALRTGKLAGAGLDAHALEPLDPTSPFWGLPNVIVTPHHGALTSATRRRGHEIFLDNLGRLMRGEPLQNVVDKLNGY